MTEIFDAHLHIIDSRFPLIENQGFLPDAFTSADYLERTAAYTLTGGVVVSGSFQGFDQSYLVNVLGELGPTFVGVTDLPYSVTDDELARLDQAGVRAVRFNLFRGNSETKDHLVAMAQRVYEQFGWHVELYVDASNLDELSQTLIALPKCSIDHLGMRQAGVEEVLRLVAAGVKVKATGFGRIDFDPRETLQKIHDANPDALMFGTDLPSTRAQRSFEASDVTLVQQTLGEKEAVKVLRDNALTFYGVERRSLTPE